MRARGEVDFVSARSERARKPDDVTLTAAHPLSRTDLQDLQFLHGEQS